MHWRLKLPGCTPRTLSFDSRPAPMMRPSAVSNSWRRAWTSLLRRRSLRSMLRTTNVCVTTRSGAWRIICLSWCFAPGCLSPCEHCRGVCTLEQLCNTSDTFLQPHDPGLLRDGPIGLELVEHEHYPSVAAHREVAPQLQTELALVYPGIDTWWKGFPGKLRKRKVVAGRESVFSVPES
ncbi:hypothetical protein DFH29DRAFT_256181 [Suillus ampliporus]|nr:hypothetical protein DFH29DRAFT_256181 [Suillus ampliporus]